MHNIVKIPSFSSHMLSSLGIDTPCVTFRCALLQVRTAALECLERVSGVKAAKAKCPLLPLAAQIITFGEEVATDAG